MIVHQTPDQAMLRIAELVREARARAGLRQDELAFAAGVSTRLVHSIEAGKPTVRVDGLVRVIAALGLTLEASSAKGDSTGGVPARNNT